MPQPAARRKGHRKLHTPLHPRQADSTAQIHACSYLVSPARAVGPQAIRRARLGCTLLCEAPTNRDRRSGLRRHGARGDVDGVSESPEPMGSADVAERGTLLDRRLQEVVAHPTEDAADPGGGRPACEEVER